MGIFVFYSDFNKDSKNHTDNTIFGLILMLGYMATDSFTSTWQQKIFQNHKNNSTCKANMIVMFGMNLFGFLFTLSSLLLTKSFFTSLNFLSKNPNFAFHCFILSITSCLGQLFIYHTIKNFGAITFVLIMTVKQALSITTSCLIYGHILTYRAVFGVFMVFTALAKRSLDKVKNNKNKND